MSLIYWTGLNFLIVNSVAHPTMRWAWNLLQNPKIVFANSVINQLEVLCLIDFCHTQVFKYVYIPTVIYIFQYILIKYILADSTWGYIEVPRGECHSMCLGLPFSLNERGLEHSVQCLHSEWLLLLSWLGTCTDIPTKTDHDIIRVLCDGDWHHRVMFWWCVRFWMTTFTSVLKGYEGWIHKRGFWVLSFELIEQSYPSQVYFGTSQHQVSQEFLHQVAIMCLVVCFIMVICLCAIRNLFL